MPVDSKYLRERYETLKQQKLKAIADVNAFQGAMEETLRLLEVVEAEEKAAASQAGEQKPDAAH
jgi:hypothetical protein